MKTYDFVICGGGMAGLSLAYYLVNSSFADKRILLIEPSEKNKNDRTWAFWEEGVGTFESIVYRSWNQLNFYDTQGKVQLLETGSYNYKVIRGIDFYEFTQKKLAEFPNVVWVKDRVKFLNDSGASVVVTIESGETFKADYVFDSTYKLKLNLTENYNLLQHFKGFIIKTEQPVFNSDVPDMMNFGVAQKNDECRFIYILPHDTTTALVEYTLFSEHLLTEQQYDDELFTYINSTIGEVNYQILEAEFGVIPMSDEPTEEFPSPRVVRIGTAGGYTNPATGYTFQNTQVRLQRLVQQLEKTGKPQLKVSWWAKRHLFYASVLLNVLQNKRYPIGDVFSEMYKKNGAATVFRFLDGKSTFVEELKIMYSTPIYHFGSAAISTITRNVKRFLS